MKTKNQWLQQNQRQIKRGEKPSGFINVKTPVRIAHEEHNVDGTVNEWTTEETKEKKIPLYTFEQTKPFTRVCGTSLRALYTSYFVSGRTKYLWWTDGHWVTCKGYLDNKKIRAHIEGKEIYGVRGGSTTNCVVVDLDLHGGSKDVVLRQLRVLLDHFHGSRKTHYSISARGVHVIIMLDKPTPIEAARAWLRGELGKLDTEELKALALENKMHPLSELEIKPSTNGGWRLPFARGRVTYIDGPLTDNDPKTFERCILWIHRPTYAPVEEVFEFISDYLKEKEKKVPEKKAHKVAIKKEVMGLGSLGRMKNRYRQTLVDFWNGKETPADSLNAAIILTAPHAALLL
jgi:hypothetical protein